jgi:hypothetical protein
MKEKSIFVRCQCGGCSLLEINCDTFMNDNPTFNMTMWVNHPGRTLISKKERIRWCERVMKTGNPWADHTIVSSEDAQRIVQFLTKYLHKHGTKKYRK